MSSSSVYEPDEDDSDFDSDIAPGPASQRRTTSRGRSVEQNLAVAEEAEDVDRLGKLAKGQASALEKLLQQIRPDSLEAYTKLLAEVEKDHDTRNVHEDAELLNVTQDGAVVWTATEKEVLYNYLDRKSSNGIKEIAVAIGTKSELEVMEHLRIVQRTIREQLHQRRLRYITVAEIPSAVEINEECCAEQEKYSKYLALKDKIADENSNQDQYADYGRIGEAEALALSDADIETPLPGDFQLAAGLFNLSNWVSMPRDLLMNFGRELEEDNWRKIAQTEEDSPAVTAEAMMDLSAVTMSLTRRLVQSAIFMAESRLRTSGHFSDQPRDIKVLDVKAAIDVLNLKRKRPSFLEIARRNRISIAAFRPQRTIASRPIGYSEAERILGYDDKNFYRAAHALETERISNKDSSEVASELLGDGDITMDEDDEEDYEGDEEDVDEDVQEDTHRHTQTERTHPHSQNPEQLRSEIHDNQLAEDQEEEQADAHDLERSRQEELSLWAMFGKVPPPSLLVPIIQFIPRPEDDMRDVTDDEKEDPAHHGISERRTQEDVVDWRDHTLYRSEWEQYGSDLEDLADDLVMNTRKRRRIDAGETEDGEMIEQHGGKSGPTSGPILSAEVVASDDDSSQEKSQRQSSSVGPATEVFKSAEIVESDGDDDDDEQEEAAEEEQRRRASPSAPRESSFGHIVESDDDDNEEDEEQGGRTTEPIPRGPLSAAVVESDDDEDEEMDGGTAVPASERSRSASNIQNDDEASQRDSSSSSGRGSPSESDDSDDQSSVDGDQGAETIPAPQPATIIIDSDDENDHPASNQQEHETRVDDSSSGSDSDSDSGSDSDSSSSSGSSPGSSSSSPSEANGQGNGVPIEISSDSDSGSVSDSDSGSGSSDESSSESHRHASSPPPPSHPHLHPATHSDPMDLDEEQPAALPPNGFM